MRQKLKKIGIVLAVLAIAAGSVLNGYWLQTVYGQYKNNPAARELPMAKIVPKTSITSSKQQTLAAGKTGQLADKGLYNFEELDHSKLNC
jgi:hypothetical protein